jgi:transposase-like protein
MVVRIVGERMYLWRAVLDMQVQRRRDVRAAQPLMRSCSKSKVSRRNCWSPTSCAPRRGVPASATDLPA